MVTFGLDISHHQAASLDMAQCRREGVEFIFIKATEGSTFIDPAFATNLNEARAAGLLVAAYHYVRSNATATAQVANVARVVPKDVPVIPDVEANSGGVALVRDVVARLQAAGYHVPLTYLPRWYWQQIGSPSLAGLPSLWSSRYPDNVVGTIADEYADVPASYWQGYGGLGVTVLQFTSSARVAGHQPLDANAYIGTREQLAAVLNQQEDDVSWTDPLNNPENAAQTPPLAGEWLTWGNLHAQKAKDAAESGLAILQTLEAGGVDVDALADKIVERFPAALVDQIAKAVVAEFKKEGN